MLKIVLAAAAVVMPAAAMAAPTVVEQADPYGANAIARNDFSRMQAKLERAVKGGDTAPEVLLNLAAIYAKQGRGADAQALLAKVLEQQNVDMATLNGSAWSHDLARKGMQLTSAQR